MKVSSKILFILLTGHLVILTGLWLAGSHRVSPIVSLPRTSNSTERLSQELANEVARLEAREQKVAETVWAKELLAEECGRTIEAFWDSLNASSNKLHLAASFPLGEIVLGVWNLSRALPHGIELQESSLTGPILSAEEWRHLVERFDALGWKLEQTEFRHNRFDVDSSGHADHSVFYFSANFQNNTIVQRVSLEGDLIVAWAATQAHGERPAIKRIDASHLILKKRTGKPPFETTFMEKIAPPENSYSIDPLILYDLDGDGLSEIILAGKNLVCRRQPGGAYKSESLCKFPPGLISTAVVADFDGDGFADFLCENDHGLVLFHGSAEGKFDAPGRLVWPAPLDIKYPMALTCGDIDGDGDLDLFLAQYKIPYQLGSMPTPYYYANDGYPAYLLINDGWGNFSDGTAAAGLEQKRSRRSYSSSFVDLDGDGHLDLVVINDFAGIDVYRGDGRGHFTDVTRKWIPESHAFGMGHAIADFNQDGRLDFLMVGMTSATASRLNHLDLWRPDSSEDHRMRSRMTFGNRLYVAKPSGGFERTSLSDSIAHSGWSWGASAFDLDNDGFPDVYVANGLESRESVRDYEAEFWLHDQYVAGSETDSAAYTYFKNKFARTRGRGQSYGGYDRNRLFLNQKGEVFFEAAYLFGVGLQLDSRNVVTDDLDGDGRVDLLFTSFDAWPQAKQTLRVYRNVLAETGNWIGFRFREDGKGKSPVGVRVTLRYGNIGQTRQIVTGDSYRSQHSNTIHFGLGSAEGIERAEIQWTDRRKLTVLNPGINRYHMIRAPE